MYKDINSSFSQFTHTLPIRIYIPLYSINLKLISYHLYIHTFIMKLPVPQNLMTPSSTSASFSSTSSSSATTTTTHSHHHYHQHHHRPHQHAHCRFQPPNPKHQPLFRKDFIVMAEFCEQKGPTPLLILPSERSLERFNVQKFVTRVLAGDHTRKHDKLGDNLTWICPEDTQVYLTDPVQGAFAYVSTWE